ncbi:hypothetical protein E2C06_16740 [Dankookia rubra]|uniref:LytR/CpsA/Psr regulator C-terminal domain-containing protein n=1 Tax=Dankookia rubra TaxID=1442381 RepID=A0A4R5QE09_9PROT|nr:hypothetical protein [Dankookia rubra]TDH61432.1 hypothetical protein E2C06_16740 [Dankookia rubra]
MLRPQRRWTFRTLVLALILCMVGAIGGIVVGLGLRPPPTAPSEPPLAAGPASPPRTTGPAQPPPEAPPDRTAAEASAVEGRLAALRRAVEQEQARLDALIRSRVTAEAEQQARLDALGRARATAEAQLATLQRDIVSAQRELAAVPRREAAPLPPIAGTAPPAAPAPAPPPARPTRETPATAPAAGGQPRVFVHHRAGSAAGAEAASAVSGTLRDGGFEVPEVRAVPAVPSQRVVRYFHAEDAAAAARLAGRLGRGWAIQDFRGYEPSPGSGTLEVWVPDR